MASTTATSPITPRNGNSSNSISSTSLRDWVAVTNKGTRRFLSHWWAGGGQIHSQRHSQVSDSSGRTSSSSTTSSSASLPSPVVMSTICAPDTEERPVESAQQFCYTSYDSGGESDDDDEALKLELLKQIALNGDENDHAPQSWGSSQASYFMYSSQKSGSAA